MGKVVFVSFADTRYQASIERLKGQTDPFAFDERYFFSEKDLPSDFFDGFSPKIYRRGYGYWTWKPYVVERVLRDLQDGDILIYSDGGNVWNGKGLERFRELLGMLTMEKPILAFQQEFLEKEWTKRDVFDKICPNDVKKYAMTLQLWGGAFILMKSPIVDEFVETWNKLRRTDLHLFTDQRSSAPNLIGFREARHDQSIFSLLVKQRPHTEISWDEVEPLDGDWTGYDRFPIQAKRSKRMPIWKRGFSFFWRRCIGYYLIYFKHFYFSGRVAWSVTIAPTAALLPNLLGGGKRNRLNPDVFPLSNNKMCA